MRNSTETETQAQKPVNGQHEAITKLPPAQMRAHVWPNCTATANSHITGERAVENGGKGPKTEYESQFNEGVDNAML